MNSKDDKQNDVTVEGPTLAPGEVTSPDLSRNTSRQFGNYELLDEIARGGMGVVYKARQIQLDRLVALKMILAGQFASAADVRRFHDEAEAAAKLDHPNIVPVYEVGEHEGQHYFSMQFVEGHSLAQRLGEPLANREAAEIVKACAEAVHYAHQRGVIHRDLKPGNVLMDARGQPRITDFGLAKRLDQDKGSLTVTGQVLGTPSYMPPEQAGGTAKQIGPPADVYALGAVLYALVTGQPPFQGRDPAHTLRLVVDEEPIPPSRHNSRVGRDLQTIILKCLEKRPDRRYASAQELADDLQRFLNNEPIHARPAGRARRLSHWVGRRPWAVAIAASTGVLLVCLLAYSLWTEIRQREVDKLVLQAQVARLSLPPRELGQPAVKEPFAEQAFDYLKRASRLRPDPKIYAEAVELLLVEGQVGQRLYPRPGAPPNKLVPDFVNRPIEASRFLLTQDGQSLVLPPYMMDVQTGRIEGLARPFDVCDPSGTCFAFRTVKDTLLVWERKTGKDFLVLNRQPAKIQRMVFSPDRNRLALVSYMPESANRTAKGRLEVWDLRTGKLSYEVALPLLSRYFWVGLVDMAFSKNSSLLAWTEGKTAKLAQSETGQVVAEMQSGIPSFTGVALSPDSLLVATTTNQIGVQKAWLDVYSATTGQVVRRFEAPWPGSFQRAVFSGTGNLLFAVFDPGGPIGEIRLMSEVQRTATVCAFDVESGEFRFSVPGCAVARNYTETDDLFVGRSLGTEAEPRWEITSWQPQLVVQRLKELGFDAENTSPTADSLALPRRLQRWSIGMAGLSIFYCLWLWRMAVALRQQSPTALRWCTFGILLGVIILGINLYGVVGVLDEPGPKNESFFFSLVFHAYFLWLGVFLIYLGGWRYRAVALGEEALPEGWLFRPWVVRLGRRWRSAKGRKS